MCSTLSRRAFCRSSTCFLPSGWCSRRTRIKKYCSGCSRHLRSSLIFKGHESCIRRHGERLVCPNATAHAKTQRLTYPPPPPAASLRYRYPPYVSPFSYSEVSFDLDVSSLDANYKKLQWQYHPDKYAMADKDEQDAAASKSSLVNKSYRTLKRPLSRGTYTHAARILVEWPGGMCARTRMRGGRDDVFLRGASSLLDTGRSNPTFRYGTQQPHLSRASPLISTQYPCRGSISLPPSCLFYTGC